MVVRRHPHEQTHVYAVSDPPTPTAAVSGVADLDLTARRHEARRAIAELEQLWPGSAVELHVGNLTPLDLIGAWDLLLDITLRRRLRLEVHAAPDTLAEWLHELREGLAHQRMTRVVWGTP